MCLLIAVAGQDPDWPLVMAGNRDERLDRPATALAVLRPARPRILGGRDEVAGGTWMAVNEHGVVAALTNRPRPEGPDPTKRTRGELPLLLAQAPDAPDAVSHFVGVVDPEEYNAAWLLVGDGRRLYSLEVGGDAATVTVHELGPGLHILENRPLGAPSAKVDRVRDLLGDLGGGAGPGLLAALQMALADHTLPAPALSAVLTAPKDATAEPVPLTAPTSATADGTPVRVRPPEADAACVHSPEYGTRTSTIVCVGAPRPGRARRPRVLVAEGPPCVTSYRDVDGWWEDALSPPTTGRQEAPKRAAGPGTV